MDKLETELYDFTRFFVNDDNDNDKFVNELADVLIILSQIVEGFDLREKVASVVDLKLNQMLEEIEKAEQ